MLCIIIQDNFFSICATLPMVYVNSRMLYISEVVFAFRCVFPSHCHFDAHLLNNVKRIHWETGKNQMNGCSLHSVYSVPNEYMSPINSITFLQIYGSVFDKMAESYFDAQYDIFYCIYRLSTVKPAWSILNPLTWSPFRLLTIFLWRPRCVFFIVLILQSYRTYGSLVTLYVYAMSD